MLVMVDNGAQTGS